MAATSGYTEYRSKETIWAKPFLPGDQHGFDADNDNAPYIECPETGERHHGQFDISMLVIDSDGAYSLVDIEAFHDTHEPTPAHEQA